MTTTFSVAVQTADIAFSDTDFQHAKVWARDNGYTVAKRGRVGKDAALAWHAAGRPEQVLPVKVARTLIASDDRHAFRAYADNLGLDRKSTAVQAEWLAAGKPVPAGYLPADVVAVVMLPGDVSVHVTDEQLANVTGGGRGRPATDAYFVASGVTAERESVLRIVTRNGAVHLPSVDAKGEFEWEWTSKRDADTQYRTEVASVHAERDAALAELETLRAELAAAQAAAVKPVRKPAARKPAARKPAAAK